MKPLTPSSPALDAYDHWSYDYQDLLDSFDYNIAVQVTQSDYQGDTWVLFQNGDRFGYLQFGWGSCSGCDALQACDTIKEVEELRDSLFNDIKWFDNARDALNFFNTHDWKGDYAADERADFIKEAKEYLEEKVK